MVVTEKKNIWVNSCKMSAKRETEIFKIVESLADDAKVEDGDRGRMRETLKQLRKKKTKEKKLEHSWKKCSTTWMRPTPESRNRAKIVSGDRGVHVLMGPRIWKTAEHL